MGLHRGSRRVLYVGVPVEELIADTSDSSGEAHGDDGVWLKQQRRSVLVVVEVMVSLGVLGVIPYGGVV
jgi:hypothetical protein